jgi:uncharacterized spore protein YtfJ
MATQREQRHDRQMRRLSRMVMRGAGARAVYGDAVEREGVTVIPVARTVWGFGGGSGGPPGADGDWGAGSGGGGITLPVGYIRITDGKASFRPIVGAGPLVFATAVIGFALARRLR